MRSLKHKILKFTKILTVAKLMNVIGNKFADHKYNSKVRKAGKVLNKKEDPRKCERIKPSKTMHVLYFPSKSLLRFFPFNVLRIESILPKWLPNPSIATKNPSLSQ